MAVLFSASELINVAIEIERNGLAFYESLGKSSKEPKICDACGMLAEMEREHVNLFLGMLDGASEAPPPDTYDDDYGSYLKSLVDSVVFSSGKARKMAGRGAGSAEALEFAMGAEKDCIIFYGEMRHVVPQRDRKLVDRIIAEEKSHLRQLTGLRKELAPKGA